MPIEQTLVKLVEEYNALKRKESASFAAPDDTQIKAVIGKIHLIGHTAAFFGGYDGMKALHDAAEALVGSDNSVGYILNQAWDGIGGWWA